MRALGRSLGKSWRGMVAAQRERESWTYERWYWNRRLPSGYWGGSSDRQFSTDRFALVTFHLTEVPF